MNTRLELGRARRSRIQQERLVLAFQDVNLVAVVVCYSFGEMPMANGVVESALNWPEPSSLSSSWTRGVRIFCKNTFLDFIGNIVENL